MPRGSGVANCECNEIPCGLAGSKDRDRGGLRERSSAGGFSGLDAQLSPIFELSGEEKLQLLEGLWYSMANEVDIP